MSGPLVKQVLAGAKTQTRRLVKPQPVLGDGGCWYPEPPRQPAHRARHYANEAHLRKGLPLNFCPYGQPGDRLWVVTIKPVDGYEDRYGVGDDGHVYRTDRPEPRRMRPGTTSKGYRTVTLCRGGRRTTALVHHLVCEAFYGARPEWAHEVRHLDGDQTNNQPENLDWGTREQNWSDKRAAGKSIHGNHHAAKLTAAQVEEIRALASGGEPKRALARKYGLAQSTVQNICSGKHWKVPSPAAPPNFPRWACRLVLEVTEVRVERLQSISEEDARAEGVEPAPFCKAGRPAGLEHVEAFEDLWVSLYGPESWGANPWVWALSFRALPATPL